MAGAGRKTTLKERKEIVEYCIAHNKDYKGTAALYDVSYSQVYSWVKKYLSNGNVLRRDFNASRPNEKWVTDVTEFKWYEGSVCHKLYLSAILDLYDRSVVAYVISRRNDNRLAFHTFDKAIASNPDAKPIFHSDRGFQYTGRLFQLRNQGMEQSMSRVSHCIDNGPTEGFWGIIKSEMYDLQTFKDEKSLRSAIEKYIHFYNYERFQERFETRAPMEVRTEALNSLNPALYPISENKRIQKYKAKFAV